MHRGLGVVAVCLAMLALAATSVAAAERAPSPTIAGTTLGGKQLALRDLRGKPVVINVWSSW